MPGPLLVFSKPRGECSIRNARRYEFHGYAALLALARQVHFVDHHSKWQRDLCTQSKPVTKQTCLCSYKQQHCCHACLVSGIYIHPSIYFFLQFNYYYPKKSIISIHFFGLISIKDLIFTAIIRALKCPKINDLFLSQNTTEQGK